MVTLVVIVSALGAEGFQSEARVVHVVGWSLLALLGLSDGARRLRGRGGALGDGRTRLDQTVGFLQAGLSLAMLLGLLPLPH